MSKEKTIKAAAKEVLGKDVKKIERTPGEIAEINKIVDKKREEGNKVVDIKKDEKDPTKNPYFVAPLTKDRMKEIIADYKKRNPVKYEAKKEALEAKLKSLK